VSERLSEIMISGQHMYHTHTPEHTAPCTVRDPGDATPQPSTVYSVLRQARVGARGGGGGGGLVAAGSC
jgi:hypothetical protein